MKKISALLLLLCCLSIVEAQTLDQSNTGVQTNYEIIDNTILLDQTFTAGINGIMNWVQIEIETFACADLTDLTITCQIWDTTGSVLLATETNTVQMPLTRTFYTFNFVAPTYVDSASSYLMRITVPYQICDSLGPTAGALHWFHDLIDVNYSFGSAYNNGTPINSDMFFKTYVTECNNPITINPSVSTPTTCGSNNGALTCSPTGGDAALSYSWSNAETTQTISSLSSGNYTITVTDGMNCSATQTINLPNITPAVFSNDTTIATTCFGLCNGTASITTTTSGTPPYTYLWDNAEITASIFNVCAGNYSYTITDVNGCTFSNTVVVAQPNELTGSFIVTNESCQFGDGFIDLNPIGDFPPFTYSWGHGPVTQDVNNLSVGSYSVTILDNQGCTSLLNENVGFDAGAVIDTLQLDIQNNLCFQTNGHIANLNGAVTTSNAPVNYTLNSISIPSTGAFNLTGALYELIATDALGCDDTASILIIDEGSPITVNQGSTYTPPCPDVCTGTIMAIVGGGSGSYTYSWSNGFTGANPMDLCAGVYTVVVTDNLGCTGTGVMTIIPATPFDVSFNVTQPNCGSSDGDATAIVNSGGTAPFTYDWSNGDHAITTDSLEAGDYSVHIKDMNNCSAFRIVSVNSLGGPTVNEVLINPSCDGFSDGMIDLGITGGTAPINVQWSTGHTTEDISGLTAGVYDVTVSDASGCMISKSYELIEPNPITITTTFTLASCGVNDGEISVTPSGGGGGAPYFYQWDSNAGSATTQLVSNLFAGMYEVTITDANGCVQSFPIALSNDNAPIVTVDQILNPNCQTGGGAIFTTVSGGTTPYNYQWSNGAISGDLEDVSEGNYSLVVTDASNCMATVSISLPGINIFAQEICMITVDSITNMNKVLWEKTSGIGIQEFRIYRETSVSSNYLLIGIVPFDSLSVFQDTVASSDIHAWKYKLATVDSCGNESEFIASHKSIHLIAEANANGDVYLEWDNYIGFPYSEFYINRNHISTGWVVIDTVPNVVFSYVDQNAPNGNVGYAITVPTPSDCEPTRAGVNTSRSNIKNTPVSAPNSVIEDNLISVSVFPNPASNELNISLENYQGESLTLKMFNAIGEIILVQNMTESNSKIDTKEIPSGLYTISLSSDKNSIVKKVMIVK